MLTCLDNQEIEIEVHKIEAGLHVYTIAAWPFILAVCSSLQAQYVFIHKAMVEVTESLSSYKGANHFPGISSVYVNRKFSIPKSCQVNTVTLSHKKIIYPFTKSQVIEYNYISMVSASLIITNAQTY